jgi:excisionase family DNA binding protein
MLNDETMSVDDAAKILGVTRDWVRKACREGVIDHLCVGMGSERFRRRPFKSGVENYVRDRTKLASETTREVARSRRRASMPLESLRY